MKRVKTSRRLVGWEAIGAVLGISAGGARARATADPRMWKLVGRTATGRPWAWEEELLAYDTAPAEPRGGGRGR